MAIGGNTKSASSSVCLDKGYDVLDPLKKIRLSGKAVRYPLQAFLYICVCHCHDLVAQTVEFSPFVRGQVLLQGNIIATKSGDLAREISAKSRWHVASVNSSSPRTHTTKEIPPSILLSILNGVGSRPSVASTGEKVISKPPSDCAKQGKNGARYGLWHISIALAGFIIGWAAYGQGRRNYPNREITSSKLQT
jgi:hypothetical protein